MARNKSTTAQEIEESLLSVERTDSEIPFFSETADNSGENSDNSAENSEKSPDLTENIEKTEVFVYLGPTIRGVIINGGVFLETRSGILKRFEKAIEKHPEIKKLIISDKNVAKTREQLVRGEGAVSVAYKKLLESIK